MSRTSCLRTAPLAAVFALGCSSGGSSPSLVVGRDGTGGGSNGGSSGFGGDSTIAVEDGGRSRGLSAHIESPPGITVEFVTLSCSNECADVLAVAKGAFAPYSYTWEDGSTDPARHVCPTATTRYQVSVADAGSSGEFARAPETVTVPLTADVVACIPDGGIVPGDADAMKPASEPFCIKNPSIEGMPELGETGFAPDWAECFLTPNVEPLVTPMLASDGATYFGALDAIQDGLNESAGTAFCAPLSPGKPISFSVDIAVADYVGNKNPGKLELWGGSASCSKEELLWTSPEVTDFGTWHTFCGTMSASKSYSFLVLWPVQTAASSMYLVVDNFRPMGSCN